MNGVIASFIEGDITFLEDIEACYGKCVCNI